MPETGIEDLIRGDRSNGGLGCGMNLLIALVIAVIMIAVVVMIASFNDPKPSGAPDNRSENINAR